MASVGTWLAMCRSEHLVPLEALASQLEQDPDITPGIDGDLLVLTVQDPLTGRTATINIGISRAPHVVLEAQELAELQVPGVPPGALAACSARYEILYDLEASDELTNPLLLLGQLLGQLSGAIVFDAFNGTFPFDEP
ncbi:MAG TPA: hypothetical protein ENK18_22745 [Deltaproteobacteria bacterium]|nr:hypothetical protein [Deltaproteobacteria bacterium]